MNSPACLTRLSVLLLGMNLQFTFSTLILFQFKDRDDLDRIFKQWIHPPSPSPSMSKVWDSRVRQHLGTRYDSRLGCFDWDLMMKLHQRHVSVSPPS